MKYKIFAAALLMVMSLSMAAQAADPTTSSSAMPMSAEKSAGQPSMGGDMLMQCPMMGKMGNMQKDMGDMMGDMQGMMKMTSDPVMKERMQKMNGKMESMMQQMSGMPKMCGKNCPMMGNMGGEKTNDASAAVAPEDHKAHHPEKK